MELRDSEDFSSLAKGDQGQLKRSTEREKPIVGPGTGGSHKHAQCWRPLFSHGRAEPMGCWCSELAVLLPAAQQTASPGLYCFSLSMTSQTFGAGLVRCKGDTSSDLEYGAPQRPTVLLHAPVLQLKHPLRLGWDKLALGIRTYHMRLTSGAILAMRT